MQGPAERFGGWETAPAQLFSLLPLQARHVERPKQKDHKGIACGGQQRPCRHIHWVSPVRHLWELTACLDSLSFLQRQAPYRAPLVPHRSVSLTRQLEKKEFWTLQASSWDRRWSGCLTDWATVQRGDVLFIVLLSVLFGAMFSDRRGCSFSCVCGRYVWMFLLTCVCPCVCVCLRWWEAPFFFSSFSNTEMWRPPTRTFFFSNSSHGSLIECVNMFFS